MSSELPDSSSHEDIQQALTEVNQSCLNQDSGSCASEDNGLNQGDAAGILAQAKSCPLSGLRYGFSRCGLMAERYPWQATLLLFTVIGCGWLCVYFGVTVLLALILYSIYTED